MRGSKEIVPQGAGPVAAWGKGRAFHCSFNIPCTCAPPPQGIIPTRLPFSATEHPPGYLRINNELKHDIMSATNDKIRGNWNQLKGKVKEQYGELTDNDLAYEEGQEDQLIGRLQEKLGQTKDEVTSWINSL